MSDESSRCFSNQYLQMLVQNRNSMSHAIQRKKKARERERKEKEISIFNQEC